MKLVHTVIDDKKCVVMLPDDADEREAYKGLVVGPPDLSSLGLSLDIETKLNNELYGRGLITQRDVAKKREEVLYALQSALQLNVDRIVRCYDG